MSESVTPAGSGSQLSRLLGFLEADPANLSLLAAAADAALTEGDLDRAVELLDRHEALAPLPPQLINVRALVLMSQHAFAEASVLFEGLLARSDSPALRFSLAWCRAMLADYAGGLALLDEAAVAASPRGPVLKIEMMHHLGQLEDALACGIGLAERYPDDQALMGALANVAIDAEELELARHYAERGADNADSLAALGMLRLDDEQVADSLPLFDAALTRDPANARALVGKGLAMLATGDHSGSLKWIDKGAEAFEVHVGSWIASGWAHYVAGDLAAARNRFERALALDQNFAECRGALAVLDIHAGDVESAERRAEVALRLDRKCFSAALAKSMLAAGAGDEAAAERIRQIAMNTPIRAGGKTIAQALANIGARGRVR